MSSLLLWLGLVAPPTSILPDAPTDELAPPPYRGTWRVAGMIDGPAAPPLSAEEIKKLTVRITDKRLVIVGGEEKQEYAIVRIDSTQRPAVIDLRDVTWRRTYRGIYEREGKRLRLCVQFSITGNAKTSVRPASFKEADPANVFGPTLFLLDPQ
jgi:uncharacterized protein (TIGR03067 family)